MSLRAVCHVVSLALAICLALEVQSRHVALGAVAWLADRDFFKTYTPYFPGFAELRTHEIFSHASAAKKKIVLLGSSAVDSIGCDYTWHRPVEGQERNVHSSCSIAAQMNALLHDRHLSGWKVFDLARNGAKLTDMLYVYSQIAALKPDVVVFGDTFNYYMWDNAGASELGAAQYAAMDETYGRDPKTGGIWQAYEKNLRDHGWKPEPAVPSVSSVPAAPAPVSLQSILVRGFVLLRHSAWAEGMPHPVAHTAFRDWTEPHSARHAFTNPDPGFSYFQGLRLIDLKQREFGGNSFVYFSPQWPESFDPDYVDGLDRMFGGFLRDHGIPHVSYVGMRMRPITETYDGDHQTLAGNHRIAVALVQDLEKADLIP